MHFKGFSQLATSIVMGIVSLSVPGHSVAQGGSTILNPAQTQKLLPQSVYYKGQSAPVQIRNSGGVKFSDGYYVLATLVDTSGYSSDVSTKYQGYFIAEAPLKISGHDLPAGIYGIGFIAGDKFVVTDVGGHEVLSVNSSTDAGMKRPMPLQVTADPSGSFRLFSGRKYIVFSR